MSVVAVIPAAGRGTRLGVVTRDMPKALVAVGSRPVISHVLAAVEAANVTDVVVVTGWMADRVESAIPALTGANVRFVRQSEPLGTAHALSLARRFGEGRPLLYSWADLVYPVDTLARLLAAGGPGSLGVNRVDDPTAGAAVTVRAGVIEKIVEKPPAGMSGSAFNASGVGVLPASIWDALEAVRPSSRGELELTEAEQALIDDGFRLSAIEIDPVFDIGTPGGLADADAWARGRAPHG